MIRSNFTTPDDAAIEARALHAPIASEEKRSSEANGHVNADESLGEPFQDYIRSFTHDPISCGHAAADFIRRYKQLTPSRASYLICLNVGKRSGAAIGAFATHMPSGTRSAIFRTALKTQPIESLAQFSRDLMNSVPERLQQDVRDDLVVSASGALGPDGLHNLFFGIGLEIPVETTQRKPEVGTRTEDYAPSVENGNIQTYQSGPNWAVVLTLFASAAFFLIFFSGLAVWLVSIF